MENSSIKSGGVVIPKKKRSLDLKSLYQSEVSEVVETTKKPSEKNNVEDVEKQKRKSKKEVSLSAFQAGVKKSKEDVNGEKSENVKKTCGNKSLHGLPPGFTQNAALFNIPKRPRGSVGRKKSESDQIPKPLRLQDPQPLKLQDSQPLMLHDSDDRVGPSNVNAMKSVIDSAPRGKSINANVVSAGIGSTSKLKSPSSAGRQKLESEKLSKPLAVPDSFDRVGPINLNVSKSRDDTGNKKIEKVVTLSGGSGGNTKLQPLGKNSRPNPEVKQKSDMKSTLDAGNSGKKLKRKAEGEEAKQSKKFKHGVAEKENNTVVISGNRSLEKQRNNSSKKKNLVDCRDGNGVSTINLETSVNDVEETRNVRIEEEENLVVNNGNGAFEKRRIKGKKKKELVRGGNSVVTSKKERGPFVGDGKEASIKKAELSMSGPVSDHSFVDVDDDDDDDDDDLEQNAARMLSSRFDPSCTGFPSVKRSSKSEGLSFPVSSGRDSVNQQAANSPGFAEAGSADVKNAALRPRGEDKGKQPQRQRRHFYDVLPKDFDALWAVNRRIKIFWPLDESWYHGLVKDYHPEVKLHHIKYDDRDEEWVDLQEEKFKLLLLPTEVPGGTKTRKRKARGRDVDGTKVAAPRSNGDDTDTRNDLDSEPIASWLTRSNQRVKSSKKRIVQMHPPAVSSISENHESPVVNDLGTGRTVNNLIFRTLDDLQNSTRLFYVRKKFRKVNGRNFGPMGVKARGNITRRATEKQPWLIGDKGYLTFNGTEFRFITCLDVLPCIEFSHEAEVQWLLHRIFMLQHGTIVTTSPFVKMEMLFIDSNHGLRFLVFEGCLRQALVFIFLILVLFNRPEEQYNSNVHLPVTSISVSIYGGQNFRKRHVFAFCSSSGLKRSKWLYLDFTLLQHCRLLKQLPVSECTYYNINNLEQDKTTHVTSALPEDMLVEHSVADDSQYAEPSSVNVETSAPQEENGTLNAASGNSTEFGAQLEHDESIKNVDRQTMDTDPTFNPSQENGTLNAASGISAEFFTQSKHDESMIKVDEKTIDADPTSNPKSGLISCRLVVDIPSSDHVVDRNVKDDFVDSPSVTGPVKHRTISSLSSFGDRSPMWPEGKTNFVQNGFSNGPKKPRTQVRYSMPFSGQDIGVTQKSQNQRPLPCKRIRKASLKRLSDVSTDTPKRSNQKNLESLVCGANLLVTEVDKGWRLSGVHVVLEVSDRNEWSLAVKFSGTTKYAYKVNHILQPGTTNRYSHAMMWKGGKDWILEFTDRSQWALFKELHEECYNRNIRAASVKNIPIPGVRLVEENDDFERDIPYSRNSMKYFRQLQTDVELAMDPSRILYDMDSDDEEWLQGSKKWTEKELSADIFEKTVDVFEKVACIQQRDNFTEAEIKEIAIGVCSLEVAKLVYGHWRQKRERKGMPLIRHLQPPLWESYQKQVKEWEQNVSRGNAAVFSSGNQGKGLLPPPEKPPMFAFCLKPRGLDVPCRGSKQRSHRKVHGHHHAASGEQDSLHLGRRSGHAFGDEKMLYPLHEYADVSPSFRTSKRTFSPPEASEWTRNPTSYKNRPKKLKSYASLDNSNSMPFKNRRNSAQPSKIGLPEMWPGQKRCYNEGNNRQSVVGQMDESVVNELQLRDATSAAQHARNMAKLKRERAHRLMVRADICVHKAVTAIMTADAINSAHGISNSEH